MWLFALLFPLLLVGSASAITGTVSSIGWCCTTDTGVDCCADHNDPNAPGFCTDGTPYCNSSGDTACTDPVFPFCSLDTTYDAYINGSIPGSINPADVVFSSCQNTNQTVVLRGAGGFATNTVGLFCLDTSSVPDLDTVNSAALELFMILVQNANGLSLLGDYYNWQPACDSGDFTTAAGTGAAFTVPLSTLTSEIGDLVVIPLTDLTNINKTGLTCFRLTLSGFTTTGTNQVQIPAWGHGTSPPPRIQVDTDPPETASVTPSRSPTQTPVATATPTGTRTGTNTPTSTPVNTITSTPTGTPESIHYVQYVANPTVTWTPTPLSDHPPQYIANATPTVEFVAYPQYVANPTTTPTQRMAHDDPWIFDQPWFVEP